jgi:hypothetical protein
MANRALADALSQASEAAYGVAKFAPDGDTTAALAVQGSDARLTAAADLAAHLADTTAAHPAEAISVTALGAIDATDVQTALEELAGGDGLAAIVHGATGKTTPVDADETLLLDSAATFGLKKLTWANVKATLKTYFDTLYGNVTGQSSSVDAEIALFSGTGGKTIKRMAGSGLVKVASGVASVATANTDYATPNQDTTGKSAKADALNSATTVVNVAAATAPTTGQVLTATDATHATWQDPSGGMPAAADVTYDNSTSLLAATDVQAAIDEVVGDLAAGAAPTGAAGGVLGGTYPNPSFAADMATQAELDAAVAGLQPLDADLTTIAGLTATTNNMLMAVASAWASRTPTQVKAALGLTPGTDIQAWDADLDTLAGLTPTTDNIIQSVAGAWASRTPAQVRTTLALVVGTNVQAWDADLDAIAGLAHTRGNLIRGGASAWEAVALGSAGQRVKSNGTDAVWGDDYTTITFVIDGGGATITTGVKGDIEVPDDLTITRATLLADQSGSIVVDIFKCTYSNYDAGSTHPVSGDKITSSAPPTISSATKAQDSTLTGWTTALSAGDILRFNVNSITTCQRATLSLRCKRAS